MSTERITLTNGYVFNITDEDRAQAARLVIGLADRDPLAINAVMEDVVKHRRPEFVMALALLGKSSLDAAVAMSDDPFRSAASVLRGFLVEQAKARGES